MELRPEDIVTLERPAETDTGIFSHGDSLIREYVRAVRVHIIDKRVFGNIPKAGRAARIWCSSRCEVSSRPEFPGSG